MKEMPYFNFSQTNPRIIIPAIAGVTVAIFIINGSFLSLGISTVYPHLFYVPIVLSALLVPRFALHFISTICIGYPAMVWLILPEQIPDAISRSILFLLTGGIIALLSLRLRESQQAEKSALQDLYAQKTESERIIRNLTENIPGIIYSFNPVLPGTLQFFNNELEKMTGYSKLDLAPGFSSPLEAIIYPDDRNAVIKVIADAIQQKDQFEVTYRIIHQSGKILWANERGRVRIDGEGKPVCIDGVILDLTWQKEAESRIENANRKWSDLFHAIGNPAIILNPNQRIVAINDAMKRLVGQNEDIIRGKFCFEIFHTPEFKAAPDFCPFRSAGNSGGLECSEMEVEMLGGHYLISCTPLYDEYGKLEMVIHIAIDVTERRRIEEALEESEQKFHMLADYTYDWDYWINPDGSILYMTPSCERITGYPVSFFIEAKENIPAIVHPEDRDLVETHLKKIESHSPEEEFDFRIIRPDKGVKWINHSCQPITGTDGRYLGRRVSNRDITDRKLAELAFYRANEKLNLLSSINRHDILNLLTALLGYLEISLQDATEPSSIQILQKEILLAGQINRLIQFSKDYQDIGVNAPQWYNLYHLVMIALKTFSESGIEIVINIPGIMVYADALLEKVFYNLGDNSVRHGCGVTRIFVTGREVPNGYLVEYTDNGCGIPSEMKKELFKRGFGKNTGMGLFLIREILSITSITIEEAGNPGSGARFEIHIPKERYRIQND